jgi:uncharacterized repeat protein (TIGR01451 family)
LPSPVWDTTHFWLVAPDSTTEIVRITYPPEATTSEKWNAFASASIADYGTGIYRLYSITDVDDQNSYKIKIVETDPDGVPNNGDEINLSPERTTYQHDYTGCTTFWFYVSQKPELRLSNFDMDGEKSVVYTDPNGNVIDGTVSGTTVWNNGGTIAYPPPGGDVFINPTQGWWKTELCMGDGDQYFFYSEDVAFIDRRPGIPDVTIAKDDSVTQTITDNTLDYFLTVENIGNGAALYTVVTDTLPNNVSFFNASDSPTITSFNGTSIVEWDLGLLIAGQQKTLELSVKVNSDASGTIQNKAYVTFTDIVSNIYERPFDTDINTIVPPASISGHVWYDENESLTMDGGEPGLEDVTVYLKYSGGAKVDSQITISDGSFSFPHILPASYSIDVKNSSVWNHYESTTLNDPLTVNVSSGEIFTDAQFGYHEGTDTDDDGIPDTIDGDGDRDNDGIPDYADYDPSGYIYSETTGEILTGGSVQVSGPGVITFVENGSNGYYEFITDGTPGIYTISLNTPAGYRLSTTCLPMNPPPFEPSGLGDPVVLGNGENGNTGYLSSMDCTPYYFTFNLSPGDPYIINNNYPVYFTGFDFGDAIDPSYPSFLANNGASHHILPGYYLGSTVDAEADGQSSLSALGDDLSGTDDEDGIVISSTLIQFSENSIDVFASADGYLNAWMDLNQNGDWSDASDHIISNEPLTTGLNKVLFNLPEITFEPPLRTVGMMARFRFSSYAGLSYTGPASDGEVEDYVVDTMIAVELVNFRVEEKNGYVQLFWQTHTETNNLGFFVYRSDQIDGIYIKVNNEIIAGAGNSESIRQYSYNDYTAEFEKKYFYKIGDVKLGGAITMHEATETTLTMPVEYALGQNYPNPFNPSTTIEYSLKKDGMVHLKIFNVSGQRVRTLVSEQRKAGQHQVIWDSLNENGIQVPSGIYMYSLNVNGFNQTRRMAFTK